MFITVRNSIVFEAETSAAIADFCHQQRQAYNTAVDHMLAHPNTSRYDLFKELTKWKRTEEQLPAVDRRWRGPLAVLRPGLTRGRTAVLAFLKADAPVLRECIKEVDQREWLLESGSEGKSRKARPPRHGNNPARDSDPKRLFRSRKNPFTLSFDDADAIRVLSRRAIAVAGLTLGLARPLPEGADVRAMQVIERESSVKQGRNRPAHDRSYDVRLVLWLEDPPMRCGFTNPVGLDIGKAILVAASDGERYGMPDGAIETWLERREHHRERQKRCKHGSRQWVKSQNAIRDCNRRIGNVKTNAERHIAVEVTNRHDAVFVEKLRVGNMNRSARGTLENPGRNVAAKRGLNRTLAAIRPGSLSSALERRSEKTGTPFAAVDARYTSQRCSVCGYTDRENRKKQAEFLCLKCGHAANADHNAARNVLFRGAMLYVCCLLMIRYAEAEALKPCGRSGVPSLADSLMLITTPAGGQPLKDRRSHQAHAEQTTVVKIGRG